MVSLSGISERLPHARGGVSKLTLDAAIEEAKALATQTAAYLNSVHTSASLTGNESYTTGLGYSYSGEVSNDVAPVTEFR